LAVAEAVGEIGSGAGTPEVLAQLACLLSDPEGDVRSAAAQAVGELMRGGVRCFEGRFGKVTVRMVAQLSS
jgi:hypothetical protein